MGRLETILVDTREKKPLVFPRGYTTRRATLQAGDYSLQGYKSVITVERKSVGDFYRWIGRPNLFLPQVRKLKKIRHRCIVVTGHIDSKCKYSTLYPSLVVERVALITASRVPIIFAGNHRTASHYALKFMLRAKLLVDTR